MDLNLQYWRSEGQSFLSRFFSWVNILDPSSLLSSNGEVERARTLLANNADDLKNEKVCAAWKLSLSSVHPDTRAILPIVFRPHAFLPIAAPLVTACLLPHNGVKPVLFWQFFFQAYSAGFNYSNGNATGNMERKMSLKQALLLVGSVTYTTCVGAIPQFAIKHYGLKNQSVRTFFRSVLPIPLSAFLAAFNVLIVRAEEFENGILVFDSNGNSVGISKKAGLKAVNETALSRALLIGTTAALPNLLVTFLKRTRFIQRSPLALAPFRHITTVFILGLMIPVSFSVFPQLGTIKRESLEKEIQAASSDRMLFYNKGL